MLRKADYHRKAALESLNIQKDIPCMSDTLVKKLSVLFYPLVTNNKGKPYRKSRRCVLYSQLSVAYCSCCEKDFIILLVARSTLKHAWLIISNL